MILMEIVDTTKHILYSDVDTVVNSNKFFCFKLLNLNYLITKRNRN